MAQVKRVPDTKTIKTKKAIRKNKPIQRADIKSSTAILGDYTVESYYVLSRKTPSKKELNNIVGSEVHIEKDLINGTFIESDSIDLYETEQMTRGDFIYRNFGREIRAPEPDIPERLNVFKTGNLNCYGIASIEAEKVALPYKGVLLILKRKR